MGQIYSACIYDIDNRIACVVYADKFHANCYSYSGTVAAAHYLLRMKPHNVVWGGDYIVLDDALAGITGVETLLGISTYESHLGFEQNNENILEKPYYDRIRFIGENNKTWKHISVLEEATRHFDMKSTRSVPYSGYLVNHSKKLAVYLADYRKKALFFGGDEIKVCIDPIPVLTEISGSPYSGGAQMAYLNGVSKESTPELAGKWSSDLLQITDRLTKGFEVVDCCFVDVWRRADYCRKVFGLNGKGLIKDGNGLYEATFMNIVGNRSEPCHIKVEFIDDKIKFSAAVR